MNSLLPQQENPPRRSSLQALLPLGENDAVSIQTLPSAVRAKCLILLREMLQAVVFNPKAPKEDNVHE